MSAVHKLANDVDRNRASELWTRILCVLFFFSGFPALIYQLTWQRALFRIFGVNIESVTIVVTAFMLGLGLGSLLGGGLSKRQSIPLLPLLAAIEALTGAFGLASLDIFDKVGALTLGLPLPVTALVTLGLVIVPTLLMGATLPLLVAHLARRSGNVGSSVGTLYYVNTLGAGAACLIATVLLFPFLGAQGSVRVAVAINAAVALGALAAYWRERRGAYGEADVPLSAPSASSSPVLGFIPVLALAGLGGFVSLSYEIFFFRTISYVSGSSVTAFALTLGAFLIGLASGSRAAARRCQRGDEMVIRCVVRDVVVANLLGFLFLPVLNWLAPHYTSLLLGGALLLIYLVARHWGSLLPSLAHLGVGADNRAGMRTAQLYLANILGAASGGIFVGFVLMDFVSLTQVAAILLVAGLACAALLVIALPSTRREKLASVSGLAGAALLLAALLPSLTHDLLEHLLWKNWPEARPPFAQVVENRSGIIAVDQTGVIYGNGMYDGQFNIDLIHDTNGVIRPYALSLFHPAPRDVLEIGFSSGSWAQVIANNPEVASLTVVEINPGYMQLVKDTPTVASVLRNPKVTMIVDDGRRWLRLNPGRRFDAIVANSTINFRANASNLLSTEFLALIKIHLKPRGIFFFNTTDSARVQRTACLSFSNGARFSNHIVVSSTPIDWDFRRWRRVLETYRIDGRPVIDATRVEDREALDKLMTLEVDLLPGATSSDDRLIESCADILVRSVDKGVVTDDNMGTEWRHVLGLE
jgi:spermidine synthase